jgi:hypothetical protein
MGFSHADILMGAKAILLAAASALGTDSDLRFLEPLHSLLQQRATPAHQLIRTFRETKSLMTSMLVPYS